MNCLPIHLLNSQGSLLLNFPFHIVPIIYKLPTGQDCRQANLYLQNQFWHCLAEMSTISLKKRRMRQTTMLTHTYSWAQFRIPNQLNMHVFRLWEEAIVPREKLHINSIQFSFIYIAPNYNKCHLKALNHPIHGENFQTPQRNTSADI